MALTVSNTSTTFINPIFGIPWNVLGYWTSLLLLIISISIFTVFAKRCLEKGKNNFYLWIATIVLLGSSLSFFLPIVLNSGFGKDDDGASLRQTLLYATGGALGIITIIEAHRKNDIEVEKNAQERERSKKDHIRQIVEERRNRYLKALELLSNGDAKVRTSGVYALFSLADDWHNENWEEHFFYFNISPDAELKNITNILWAYLRSTPPHYKLLDHPEIHSTSSPDEMSKAKLEIKQEAEVRQTIFSEFSKRLKENQFDYGPENLAGSKIFYPLTNLHFQSAIFTGATFYPQAKMVGLTFTGDADFSFARFKGDITFFSVNFEKNANFENSHFEGSLELCDVDFIGKANFNQIECRDEIIFNLNYGVCRISNKIERLKKYFQVSPLSNAKFNIKNVLFMGKTFYIPDGVTIFDPDHPNEKNFKYIDDNS